MYTRILSYLNKKIKKMLPKRLTNGIIIDIIPIVSDEKSFGFVYKLSSERRLNLYIDFQVSQKERVTMRICQKLA